MARGPAAEGEVHNQGNRKWQGMQYPQAQDSRNEVKSQVRILTLNLGTFAAPRPEWQHQAALCSEQGM